MKIKEKKYSNSLGGLRVKIQLYPKWDAAKTKHTGII